jgi:hypothetical protein
MLSCVGNPRVRTDLPNAVPTPTLRRHAADKDVVLEPTGLIAPYTKRALCPINLVWFVCRALRRGDVTVTEVSPSPEIIEPQSVIGGPTGFEGFVVCNDIGW